MIANANAREVSAEDASGELPGSGEGGSPSGSSRVMRLLSGLFSVHAEVARQELSREQSRIVSGVILLFVGLTCLAMLILLLQGFGVWLLLQRGLALGWALLTMGGIDALVGVVAILLGRRALARPLLPETRALIRRTLATVIS